MKTMMERIEYEVPEIDEIVLVQDQSVMLQDSGTSGAGGGNQGGGGDPDDDEG